MPQLECGRVREEFWRDTPEEEMSSNLKEELKEVLQFADSLIELISEHHDIERVRSAR